MSIDMTVIQAKLFQSAKAAGFTEYEIYYAAGVTDTYRVFGGEIAEYKSAGSDGLSFRGVYQGKMGYASSERIDEAAIPFLIENAKQNALIIESEDAETLYEGEESYPVIKGYNQALAAVPSYELAKTAIAFETEAFAADVRVTGLSYCLLGRGAGEVFIANSKGLRASHKDNYVYGYLQPKLEDGEDVKTGFAYRGGSKWDVIDASVMAQEAVAEAVSKLGAAPVASGSYDVLLGRDAMMDLFEAFAGVFNAESVQKGFSLLAGKMGTAIASETVSIRDDALLPDAPGSVPFDSEGVAAKNKALVENGVLKSFLHNRKTAAKDGVASTGNGFKASFRASVGIQPTNLYIVPTEATRDDMLMKLGNGLFITEFEGLHAGTNEVSGDFSLSSRGFVVENGKITAPVEQITVAGSFFTLLKEIEAVGGDFRWGLPGSGIGTPSVLVRGLSVSGK